MTLKIAFISLGCSKNLINTEQMMALCKAAGHQVTGEPEGADVAVLNTCGFIDAAKSEAIEHIIALGELKQAGKLGKLLVCGCLSQRYPGEIKEELPEVDGLMGTGSYDQIVSAVEAVAKGENPDLFGDISATSEEGERLVTTPVYTAFLKIAEGCDNFCAFCIIPYLRGRYRSRPMEAILQEAKELADAGVKELILIAQDIGPYGKDLYGERKLSELLRQLCKLPFHWIRLHYLYPDHFDDEVIGVIASQPRIVKYLDIPLQHCSDRLLKSMNRGGLRGPVPIRHRDGHRAGGGLPVLPGGGHPGRRDAGPGTRGGGPAAGGSAHRAPVPGAGRVQRKPPGHGDGGPL